MNFCRRYLGIAAIKGQNLCFAILFDQIFDHGTGIEIAITGAFAGRIMHPQRGEPSQ